MPMAERYVLKGVLDGEATELLQDLGFQYSKRSAGSRWQNENEFEYVAFVHYPRDVSPEDQTTLVTMKVDSRIRDCLKAHLKIEPF